MTVKDFLVVLTSFLEGNLGPGIENYLGGAAPWILGGVMAGISRGIAAKVNENAELLKMLGIMSEDGNISIDGVEEFLEGAFEKSPELRIDPKKVIGLKFDNPLLNSILDGEIVFRPDEGKEFIELLRSQK